VGYHYVTNKRWFLQIMKALGDARRFEIFERIAPDKGQFKSVSTMIVTVCIAGPIFQLARRFHAGIL